MPPHEHRLAVRYSETDQMGLVHHSSYLVYMEEGRTRAMAELGAPYHEVEASGTALVVRKASLRYRAGARYGDELLVRTAVERVGGASVAFRYEIERAADATPVATGSTELACVDLRDPARRPKMLPAELRAILVSAAEA